MLELAQPPDHPLEALPAGAALLRQRGLELVVVRVHADAQDVDLALTELGGLRRARC